jgi:signal transduction histidine kinase
MIAVSVSISLILTLAFFIRYISDTPHLREATLYANATAIARALNTGKDPAKLSLYVNYPQAYGFRVYDRRSLARRRILASANTRWLPAVEELTSSSAHSTAVASDLFEGFERLHPDDPTLGGHAVSLLIHRTVVSGHKYWIQTYMIGDPAWAGLPIVVEKLVSHVFLPALLLVPALTLAIFLATRAALKPLRELAQETKHIGRAVARGQALTPVAEAGMAREFADVAAAVNTVLRTLERSLLLQKQFTSDIAHELRTPLAVLLLETSRLSDSPARTRIKADIESLAHLVNELLRFAQAEDTMAHEATDVDLVATARKVCEEAAPTAVARGQAIELDCEASHMIATGSPGLIEIAIRNLVENALKYSPVDSTVAVRIDDGATVIVEDQGPGIPDAQRNRVFQRFWRADRDAGSGAGVGLALVHRIAQLHDGSIRIENRPRGGTRMVLTLAPATEVYPSLQNA